MKKLLVLCFAAVLCLCCLASCELIHTALKIGEHTYEYIVYETGHYKQYTCGCPSPDIMGQHCDNDGDLFCDACGYKEFKPGPNVELLYTETHHWWVPTGSGIVPSVVYGYGEHEDLDENLFCDVCGYNIYPLIPPDIAREYSLTMNNEEWLYEDLLATYKAGETVIVKIKMALDIGYLFLVNGEKITNCMDVDGLYWEFTFTMPSEDAVIDFKTYDGFLPDANYAILYETCWIKNSGADYVSIRHYYGEYSNSAIVAMIDCSVYTDAEWSETVGNTVIQYNDGNRITVLYNGEFYTLTDAYKYGYLTAEDLIEINEKHKEFNNYLYE